jgi:hypothetical protein
MTDRQKVESLLFAPDAAACGSSEMTCPGLSPPDNQSYAFDLDEFARRVNERSLELHRMEAAISRDAAQPTMSVVDMTPWTLVAKVPALIRAVNATGAARGAATLESSAIRFSQSSVNGAEAITNSMRASGWVGAPIDVVSIEGRLITVDNTRLLAAQLSGTPVQAVIRGAGEALPASMAGRFGAATTWGEAVTARIAGQNAAYRAANPLGSWFIGVTP